MLLKEEGCVTCTLYLQSILLSAAYFSGLKSLAVITSEKWVTLRTEKYINVSKEHINAALSHHGDLKSLYLV